MKRETAALLLAGSFFFGVGKVNKDVIICGVSVGGMAYDVAEIAIRDKLFETLRPVIIHAPSGDLVLDGELTVRDDIARLVREAKRGETLEVSYTRTWVEAEEVLRELCEQNSSEAKDAEFTFSASGFRYTKEVLGVACDYRALLADVTAAMQTGGEVTLSRHTYAPEVTEADLRAHTKELSSFRTCFDGSNTSRKHNIALAASRIAGTVLEPHGEFSFNKTVGERTEKNGFRTANIILDGEFVPGVGGGVCQASTTLFGAALRAGMTVTESRAHSLAVGYVPPSQDAMVSSASDLRFVNPYDFPVYILAEVGQGSVCFRFFGTPDGKRYEVESRVIERTAPPPPEQVVGEEGIVRAEKEGMRSESYLVVYGKDGKLFTRTRIRRDNYAAVRGKVGVPAETAPDEAAPEEKQKIS